MNLKLFTNPVMGLPVTFSAIAEKEVAGGQSNVLLESFKVPPFAAIYEAVVYAYDATAKEVGAYIIRATAKNLPNRAAKATGTLTSTGNFTDSQTVTIGSKVYTFQTTLTNVDGNVLIGADRTASHANLKAAINLEAGAGTTYALATTIHPTVEATSATATTTVVRAKSEGTAGNSIATTETQTNAAWGGANLSGGLDAVILVGSVAAEYTTEDDAGWTATLAVNGPAGTMELRVTADGTNPTRFGGTVSVLALG